MEAKPADRRRSKRYELSLRVMFRRQDSTHFFDAQTENISVHGAFVSNRREQLEVGTPVLLMFKEGELEYLALKGRVARTRDESSDPDDPPGLGISFEDMDDAKLRALALALERTAAARGQ